MKDLEKKHILVQTKISPTASSRLDKVCKLYSFSSRYELLQCLISVFLQHADPDAEEDEESVIPVEVSRLFEELQNKLNRINTSAPSAAKLLELSESVQVYRRSGRNGIAVAAYTFKGEDFTKTSSKDKAIRIILKRLSPDIYRQLDELARALEVAEISDVLSYLLSDAKDLTDSITRDISEEMSELSTAERHVDLTGDKPIQTRDNIWGREANTTN